MPVWGFFLIFFSQVEHFTCLSWKQKLFMYNGQSSLGFSHTRHSPHWSWEQTFMYKAAWFFPTQGIHLICPHNKVSYTNCSLFFFFTGRAFPLFGCQSHAHCSWGFSAGTAFTWSVLGTKPVMPAAVWRFQQAEHSPLSLCRSATSRMAHRLWNGPVNGDTGAGHQ